MISNNIRNTLLWNTKQIPNNTVKEYDVSD